MKPTRHEVVTSAEVTTSLARSRQFVGEEEKVLRMRYGARVEGDRPLERVGQDDPDLAAELLLIEMQLLGQARALAVNKVAPLSSRTKDKIVRALRRKH